MSKHMLMKGAMITSDKICLLFMILIGLFFELIYSTASEGLRCEKQGSDFQPTSAYKISPAALQTFSDRVKGSEFVFV